MYATRLGKKECTIIALKTYLSYVSKNDVSMQKPAKYILTLKSKKERRKYCIHTAHKT
jgi:hypothetical protein